MASEWTQNPETGELITWDKDTNQWVGESGEAAKGFSQPAPTPAPPPTTGEKAIQMTEQAGESLMGLVDESESGLQYGSQKLAGQVKKGAHQTGTVLGRRAPSIPTELLGQQVAQNNYMEKKSALIAQVNQGLLQGAANLMTAQGLAQERQRDIFAIAQNIYETLKTTIIDNESQVRDYWANVGYVAANPEEFQNEDGTWDTAKVSGFLGGSAYTG